MLKLNLEDSKFVTNSDVLRKKLGDRRDVSTLMVTASYAAIFSAFLLKLTTLYIPLIYFIDHSLVDGITLFMSKTDSHTITLYCAEVIYFLILYSVVVATIATRRSLLAYGILLNWINVGVLLAFLSIPYTRNLCLFKLVALFINRTCFRVIINNKLKDSE